MAVDGTLLDAYVDTLRPLVAGLPISAFIGIAVGVAIGLTSWFDSLFSPIFIVMQAAPLEALIPLLVMVYGIGLMTSKVFVVCIMAMPVIVLNTAGSVRNAPVNLKEMGRFFLGSERDVILKIVIPSASPASRTAIRMNCPGACVNASVWRGRSPSTARCC